MPQGQLVTLELAEKMWEAWRQKQSYSHVAKVCGVSRPTATKYAEVGDEDRGIMGFRERLQLQVRETRSRVEKRVVYTQAESQAAVREQVRLLDRLINKACTLLMKDMVASKVTLTSISKAMLARNEIVRRMCPFDEVSVTETHATEQFGVTEFDGRSALELEFFADHDCRWPTDEELLELQQAAGVNQDGEPIDVEAEHQRWGAEGDEEEEGMEETG